MKWTKSSLLIISLVVALQAPVEGQSNVTLVSSTYSVQSGVQIAPGQVLTLLVTGLKTVFPPSAPVQRATSVPLPTSIAGISATLQQTGVGMKSLPLFAIQQIDQCSLTDNNSPTADCIITALSLQIPSDISVPNPLAESPVVQTSQVLISENGISSRAFNILPVAQAVHIARTCDLISGGSIASTCSALITHADGSLVSLDRPANPGEILVMYALGLGTTSPMVASGQPSPTPAATIANQVALSFNYVDPLSLIESPPALSTAPPQPVILFAGLAPGIVGVYQINFRLAPPTSGVSSCSAGTSPNLTLTLQGSQGSTDQAMICVNTGSSSPSTAASFAGPSASASIPLGVFVPQTAWFPVGTDLSGLGKPLLPGTGGVPGPSRP
jgi:uncharacterized protein (TIGR03437 family)